MRSHRFGVLLLILAVGLSAWAVPRLPPSIATHWNARGEPDGFSPRGFAVALIPAVMGLLYLLLGVFPRIDPQKRNYEQFRDTYWLMGNAVLLFLVLVHFLVVGKGLGLGVNVSTLIFPGVGLLFVLIGRFLGRVEPNWFVGVRTPWTLSSEQVWRSTHRTTGWLFVGAGIVMIALAAVPPAVMVPSVLVVVGVLVIVPLAQSYILRRREQISETSKGPGP